MLHLDGALQLLMRKFGTEEKLTTNIKYHLLDLLKMRNTKLQDVETQELLMYKSAKRLFRHLTYDTLGEEHYSELCWHLEWDVHSYPCLKFS